MKNSNELNKSELHLILSRFSHEIRNPIGLLSSQLQFIADEHPEIQNFDGWDNVNSNLDYLSSLLNDLSDYNHADLLHCTLTPMSEFLLSVLNSVRVTLNYLNIAYKIDVPENLPNIFIDTTKIRQAILNLLRNAEEATSTGGLIQVKSWIENQILFLSIQDNGCGIPKEHISTLFEPFVTHKSNGSGLGLAITKQILESHDGNIFVESIPSIGSTFTISLPISDSKSSK